MAITPESEGDDLAKILTENPFRIAATSRPTDDGRASPHPETLLDVPEETRIMTEPPRAMLLRVSTLFHRNNPSPESHPMIGGWFEVEGTDNVANMLRGVNARFVELAPDDELVVFTSEPELENAVSFASADVDEMTFSQLLEQPVLENWEEWPVPETEKKHIRAYGTFRVWYVCATKLFGEKDIHMNCLRLDKQSDE